MPAPWIVTIDLYHCGGGGCSSRIMSANFYLLYDSDGSFNISLLGSLGTSPVSNYLLRPWIVGSSFADIWFSITTHAANYCTPNISLKRYFDSLGYTIRICIHVFGVGRHTHHAL
jgi:hypothetical protein